MFKRAPNDSSHSRAARKRRGPGAGARDFLPRPPLTIRISSDRPLAGAPIAQDNRESRRPGLREAVKPTDRKHTDRGGSPNGHHGPPWVVARRNSTRNFGWTAEARFGRSIALVRVVWQVIRADPPRESCQRSAPVLEPSAFRRRDGLLSAQAGLPDLARHGGGPKPRARRARAADRRRCRPRARVARGAPALHGDGRDGARGADGPADWVAHGGTRPMPFAIARGSEGGLLGAVQLANLDR